MHSSVVGSHMYFGLLEVVAEEAVEEEVVAGAVAVAVPDPDEAGLVVAEVAPEEPVAEVVGGVQDSILKDPVQLMENLVMVLLTPAHCFPGMVPL